MKGCLKCLSLILLFIPMIALSNYKDVSELPDKTAAEHVMPLLKALNSRDVKELTAFVKEHYDPVFLISLPLNRHVERLEQFLRFQGDIKFHSSRDYLDFGLPENEIHVVLKPEEQDLWLGTIIVVSAKPPHKIERLRFVPARRPSNLPEPTPISLQQAVSQLNAFAELMSKMELFSGAVLLAKDDEVLYQSAFGQASKRFDVANKVDTKFNLGSMDKMLTSVAIMQLVDAGKLSLNDKLKDIIDPSWLGDSISDKIEIQHLLTHSAGLGNNFLRAISSWPHNSFVALKDYKVIIKEETQYFEPGTNSRYSNTGMFLLGVVIERVSGKDYFSYIQDNIYSKAGMTDSGAFDQNYPTPNLAIGYHREDRSETGWRNNLFDHVVKGSPAGGSFSTIGDIHRFALALKKYELLTKKSTDAALSAKPDLYSARYGYGFGVNDIGSDVIVGHEGGTRGVNSNLDLYLKEGYVAVVMSNYTDGAVHLKRKIRELLARVSEE